VSRDLHRRDATTAGARGGAAVVRRRSRGVGQASAPVAAADPLLQTVPMIRPLIALVLLASLTACGFHLRGKLALPADTAAVRVTSTSPYSELVKLLKRGLTASGATIVDEDELAAQQAEAAEAAATTGATTSMPLPSAADAATGADATEAAPQGPGYAYLKVLSERWGDKAIAIDAQGRAQEYSLRYAAIFTLLASDGSVLVPQQVIELSRDYVAPATDSTGTNTEREILADELRKDMAASMLRRIDSVVRSRLEKGIPLETGTPASDQPAPTAPVQPPLE
jgi:LPS-assembly lipoprotein